MFSDVEKAAGQYLSPSHVRVDHARLFKKSRWVLSFDKLLKCFERGKEVVFSDFPTLLSFP